MSKKNRTNRTSTHGNIPDISAQTGSKVQPTNSSVGTTAIVNLGIKRPGREAGHCPSLNVDVKNVWSHCSTPPPGYIMWHLTTQQDISSSHRTATVRISRFLAHTELSVSMTKGKNQIPHQINVSQKLCSQTSFCLRKMTTNPHTLAHINTECPDDKQPELYMYIWERILDSYQYIPVAHVTVHCMIWP
jgi:hypothetical protein